LHYCGAEDFFFAAAAAAAAGERCRLGFIFACHCVLFVLQLAVEEIW
jgi:hypothetical protein